MSASSVHHIQTHVERYEMAIQAKNVSYFDKYKNTSKYQIGLKEFKFQDGAK